MAEEYDNTVFAAGTIHHAAELGSIDRIKALEAEGRSLHGYPEAVTLQKRDDVLGAMAIHVAAEKGKANVVKYLIGKFTDLDAGDGHMVTPLHLASITGHLDIVKMLLNAGANLSRQDNEGDQPLHWAATKGYTEIMELLLERGASIEATNKAGWTPLHRAAFNGRDGACRLLVRRGAGLHAITGDGCTPLHLAARNNHLGVMHQLTSEFGARTDFRNSRNQTPQDCCITDGARKLLAEVAAAQQKRGKPAVPSRVPSAASTSSKVQDTGKPSAQPVTAHKPAPRHRPTQNARLDQDGFPVASVDAAEHDPTWEDHSGAAESTQLFAAPASNAAEHLAAMLAASPVVVQQSRGPSMAGAAGPHARSSMAGHAGGPAVSGAPSARGGELVSPWSTDRMSEASMKSMPARPSQNKKFLDRYQLNKMGLFGA